MSEQEKTEFQKAIEARNAEEPLVEVDLTELLGGMVAGRKLPKVGIRIPTKRAQDVAIVAAHKWVNTLARDGGKEDVEGVKQDRDVLQDAKAACIVSEFVRDLKSGGKYPAFTPQWACENLRPEEIAALLNVANAVRAERQGLAAKVTDEGVEAWIKLCDEASSTDVPAQVLAGCAREYLEFLVISMALKVVAARDALDLLQRSAPTLTPLGVSPPSPAEGA